MTPDVTETTPLVATRQREPVGSWCGRGLVEPVAVTFLLANGYTTALRTQFLYQRVADSLHVQILQSNHSQNTCVPDNGDDVTHKVQGLTAMWTTYLTLAKLIPMVLSTLYYGSLSDQLGRRVCLLLPPIGCVLGMAVDLAIGYFQLPLYYFFFEVIENLFGGTLVFKLGCSAFLADAVPTERRSLRMTILDSLSYSAVAFSALVVGILKSRYGFLWSFVAVMVGNTVVIGYTLLCVPDAAFELPAESLINTSSEDQRPSVPSSGRTVTGWRHLVAGIKLYIRDDGSGRLWKLDVLLLAFFISALSATGHIITLYQLNAPLCWDSNAISLFNFSDFQLKAVAMAVTVGIARRWVRDDWLALAGRVSSCMEHVYLAFCITTPMMFAAPPLGCLNLLTEPMTKSLMTSLVQPTEQGALLAVFSLAPVLRMASGAILAAVYSATLSFFRGGSVFLISAGVHFISLVMLGVYIWRRRRQALGSQQAA